MVLEQLHINLRDDMEINLYGCEFSANKCLDTPLVFDSETFAAVLIIISINTTHNNMTPFRRKHRSRINNNYYNANNILL